MCYRLTRSRFCRQQKKKKSSSLDLNHRATFQIFSTENEDCPSCAAAAAAAKSLESSPTLRPHRRQPTRLPHPWDSPGKNTGVGCHFLLQCMKVKVKVKSLSRVWLLMTPWTAAYQAPRSMGFSSQEYWSGVPSPSPLSLLSTIYSQTVSESWKL